MKLLVTGATGYIGKHVIMQALAAGHHVRASLRSRRRESEVRAAVGDGQLEFVELDLMSDDGWEAAVADIDGLIHTASPVPIQPPDDPDTIIRPAVDGTRRAVQAAAAAGVGRVVVTSSIAAVHLGLRNHQGRRFGPDDWTDVDAPGVGAYGISKTLAESAAREIASQTPGMSLVTINPGVVLGAPLDAEWKTSLELIDRLLRGKDPVLPRLSFSCVSVHDVAEAHLRGLDARDGTRVIASVKTLWLSQISALVRQAVPTSRPARRTAPDWVFRVLARFDPLLASIVPSLGDFREFDYSTLRDCLGRDPAPPDLVIAESARALDALSS